MDKKLIVQHIVSALFLVWIDDRLLYVSHVFKRLSIINNELKRLDLKFFPKSKSI